MTWRGALIMTVDQARRRQLLVRWHRRMALVIFAWLGLLAISGMLINHAHDWGLDRAALPAGLQLHFYGVTRSNNDFCRKSLKIDADCQSVFGRLDWEGGSVLLAEHSLYLLDGADRLVEKLPVAQMGLSGLQGGFTDSERVYLRGAGATLVTDTEFMEFNLLADNDAAMLVDDGWQERAESEAITWERLLLDLHAARFLGPFAKVFNDVAAGLILLLVVSGFWLYLVRRNANGGNGGAGR